MTFTGKCCMGHFVRYYVKRVSITVGQILLLYLDNIVMQLETN